MYIGCCAKGIYPVFIRSPDVIVVRPSVPFVGYEYSSV